MCVLHFAPLTRSSPELLPLPAADPEAECDEVVGSCSYVFYVETVNGQRRLSFTRSCTTNILFWVIPLALVLGIIVLGLLFLIILKLCLVVCVSDLHVHLPCLCTVGA